MKAIKGLLPIAVGLLLASTLQSFAIEGLKLTVVCPDVVLSWPSVESETYIVQHRQTLATNELWVTLTNSLPAESGTNLTIFVHSNRVDCPTGQIFGMMTSNLPPSWTRVSFYCDDAVKEILDEQIARKLA